MPAGRPPLAPLAALDLFFFGLVRLPMTLIARRINSFSSIPEIIAQKTYRVAFRVARSFFVCNLLQLSCTGAVTCPAQERLEVLAAIHRRRGYRVLNRHRTPNYKTANELSREIAPGRARIEPGNARESHPRVGLKSYSVQILVVQIERAAKMNHGLKSYSVQILGSWRDRG